MNPATLARFATSLGVLAELYRRELTPAVVEAYWQALSDYPLDALEQAMLKHLKDPQQGRFFPTPADLLVFLSEDNASLARQAWAQLTQAARRQSAYDSVCFEDVCLQATLADMGGWIAFCHQPARSLPFLQREFLLRYQDHRRHPPPTSLPPFPGILGRQTASEVVQIPTCHAKELRLPQQPWEETRDD